ncbi:MAG TPA: hypothetical protein PLP33_12460 [Leptospiraceae bacterium]|nr:hypothetical protein [Leptospiraceae bacterium]HNA10443.1 hypothetical protein [Leptospiraceae bacterium]HNC56252.1 hypothetical protein [Leptospiraceae bacterium]HNE11543.1 hypothetical protein [Leptospiraceae bacterium]HNF55925.1 hypothetical protein [Leptospiraceae bacterium]
MNDWKEFIIQILIMAKSPQLKGTIINPEFKPVEFDGFRKQAGVANSKD